MKTKTLNFIIASVFVFVFLISLGSAALTISPSTITFNENGSKQVTATSNESTIDFDPSFTIGGVTFDVSGNKTLDSNNETVLTITPQEDISDFEFLEEFSSSFEVFEVSGDSETKIVNVNVQNNNFCEVGNPGDLSVDISDIRVIEGYGEDEEWFPLDEVEIEFEVENDGNEDVEDVSLEWGIYDTQSEEWLIEVDEEDEFDVDEDDTETLTASFTIDDDLDIDLEDLEDGTYTIYVRATGEVADGPKEGDDTCESDSEDAEIIIEDDFVIIYDLEMPETAQCTAEINIHGEVWNIGDDDQDEVEVRIFNTELGLNRHIEIGDIDRMEDESFDISFKLEEDVEEKTYPIYFEVLDEDNDVYENDFDDEKSFFSRPLTIENCKSEAQISVSASLVEGGKAGKQMVVKATMINTGDSESTYSLNLAGYSDWADSASLDKNQVTLTAGQSEEVLITLDVNKDAEGTQNFNLEVLSDNELIATQPVQVTVEKKSGFGITGLAIGEGNWHLWAIGALNVILVILIIIIAIRISRK